MIRNIWKDYQLRIRKNLYGYDTANDTSIVSTEFKNIKIVLSKKYI